MSNSLPGLAAALAKAGEDVTVVVAGDGPLRAELEAQAKESAPGRLRLLGVRQDIPRLLASADLFVFLPDGAEGLGLGPFEALAAGVPVVSTTVSDLGSLPPGPGVAHRARGRRRARGRLQAPPQRRGPCQLPPARGLELVSGRLNVARAAERHVQHYLGHELRRETTGRVSRRSGGCRTHARPVACRPRHARERQPNR